MRPSGERSAPTARAAAPLLGLATVLAGCGGASTDGADGARAESLVLFVVDTLRADALGVYGAAGDPTPRIDAFAGEALVFDAAYAQATHTHAAMAAMLTGLHPHHNGVLGQSSHLAPGIRSFAPLLQRRSYATGAFVASHCVRQGNRRLWWAGWDTRFCAGDDTDEQYRWDAEVVDAALAWIAEQDGPFVAWVMLFDPHDEYFPAPDLWDYAARPQPTGEEQRRRLHDLELAGEPPPADELEELRALYAAQVRGVDREFGRLADALADRDDVAVILTADHGEELFESSPRAFHGRVLTDGVLHVPLVIRAPGVAPGRFAEPVETLQVAPTVFELLDEPVQRAFDGPSLLSASPSRGWAASCWGDVLTVRSGDLRVWTRAKGLPRDPLFHFYVDFDTRSPVPWLAQDASAVRYGPGGPVPIDLGADAAAPGDVGALLDLLEQHAAAIHSVAEAGEAEVSDELRGEMEDLGYL